MGAQVLQIQALGELTVFSDGQPIPVPGSRKTRALLGYLLLQSRSVTREHLCELLWPHPDDPRAALRWSLTKLRPVLDGQTQHLIADRTSVRIEGLDDRVDILSVDKLLRTPIDRIETPDLQTAAELFHGELLEGMEIPDCHRFIEWVMARREAARRSQRTILETLTARLAGDPAEALVHARSRVTLDPLDETAHIDVVRLLSGLGRVREAREQAARCREVLNVELGVVPGPMLAEALRGLENIPEENRSESATASTRPLVPTKSRAPAAAGLFGRAEECVRLEAFLDSNSPQDILFLEGEPGIGKSRLLGELHRRAGTRDILVLIGRSWEVEMIRPYGVWIDLLATLPTEFVSASLRADLSPVLPSLGEPLHSAVELEQLLRALGKLVEALGETYRTVVFVFDDIQWIDQASVELLRHVSSQHGEARLRIACAGRPGELADNEAARSLIRGWNRSRRVERLSIEPLPERDAAALARSLSESVDVEDVVRSCGGNPLYVIESSRLGPARIIGSAVASLVADRLSSLDEPTKEIARWAAVLGHAFPATRMADLLSQSLPDLLERTETLERHGIFRPHGDEWDFAHDLLRGAALAELSGPRRTLMHRRIAHTISSEPDPDGTLANEVAFHAVRGGEPELASRAAVSAGDRALRLAAYEDAWRIADRGLVEVAKLLDETSLELHVELLRIQVLASLGRKRRTEIVDQLTGLVRRAREAGSNATERTACWLLSIVTEEAGDFDSARRHSLGAEAASRTADPQTRLRGVANTARCLMQLEREPGRARLLLREAEDLSESLRMQVLDIPWGRGMLCAMEGRVEEARIAFERGADLARDEENHWARFECLSRLSMLDLAAGDLAAVEERDSQLLEVADKLGEGSEHALASVLLALARRKDGNPAAGLEPALAELRATDSKGLLAYALNEAGRLDLADGNTTAAARCAEEALQAATDVGRHHQHDRAMLLKTRAALAAHDEETTDHCMEWLRTRLEKLSPDAPNYGDLRRLHDDVTSRKEDPK